MTGIKKSTDPGLSNNERKELRGLEAKEAIADHEEAQRASNANRQRLRDERLAREALAGPMLYQPRAFRMKRLSQTSGFQQESKTRSTRQA